MELTSEWYWWLGLSLMTLLVCIVLFAPHRWFWLGEPEIRLPLWFTVSVVLFVYVAMIWTSVSNLVRAETVVASGVHALSALGITFLILRLIRENRRHMKEPFNPASM